MKFKIKLNTPIKVVVPEISKFFKLIPYRMNRITDYKNEYPIYRWLWFNWCIDLRKQNNQNTTTTEE